MASIQSHDDRKRLLPIAFGSLMVVVISAVSSVFAAILFPDRLRIRWHVGTYEHWGPEYVASEFVLIGFPALIIFSYVASRVIQRSSPKVERSQLFETAVLAGLGMLLIIQLTVLGLNVVIR